MLADARDVCISNVSYNKLAATRWGQMVQTTAETYREYNGRGSNRMPQLVTECCR